MGLADTSGLQREQHDAGLLTCEYRKSIFVRLLKPAPVVPADGRIAEMKQVRFRGDRLGGETGITKLCRVVGHRLFPINAKAGRPAGNKTVNAYAGRGCGAGQARST
jgi:hypothetical protein